jgi:hypothetical protein
VAAVLVAVIVIVVVSSPISIFVYHHFLLNKLLYFNLSNVISNVVPPLRSYLLFDKHYFIYIVQPYLWYISVTDLYLSPNDFLVLAIKPNVK